MPLNSLSNLADYLDNLSVDLPVIANGMAKECADAIAIDLVNSTPVDVGTGMSNWIVSLDAPALEAIPAYAPSPRGRMRGGQWTHTVDPSTTFFANVGPAETAIHEILEVKQPEQDVFISNNLPYIEELNSGSSTQEPANFVERAIIVGETLIKKLKVL